MGREGGERVLAGAEADLEPERAHLLAEGAPRIGRGGFRKAEAGQGRLDQRALARPQPVTALPSVEPLGLRPDRVRIQRSNADRSAGTRSVRSQVKSSRASSGVRPKCPNADVLV